MVVTVVSSENRIKNGKASEIAKHLGGGGGAGAFGELVFVSPPPFEEMRQGLSIHIVSVFVVVLSSSQAEDWEWPNRLSSNFH